MISDPWEIAETERRAARKRADHARAIRRGMIHLVTIKKQRDDLQPGDPVLVNKIWAGTSNPFAPLRDWFSGYAFKGVEAETNCIMVTIRFGLFKGMDIRYPSRDVAPDDGSGIRVERVFNS